MRPRRARGFGWVAALALCGVLAADQDASARRHWPRTRHLPTLAQEFRGLPNPPGPIRFADTRLEPVAWSEIDGWDADDQAAAFATFLVSCRALVGGAKGAHDVRPLYAPLVEACRRAKTAGASDRDAARKFFEENFRPAYISKLEDPNGFLTGYYEPVVDGSRVLTDEFKVPLYRRPDDAVPANGLRKGESFPNGGAVVRSIGFGRTVPYFERAEIEDGALAARNLEICYLRDWIDAFFIQIQGSARIRLPDGGMLRVNYDGHNGQRYVAVGRILIERNIIPREEMSMERIRQWMTANPEAAKEVRAQNKSFVFFRVTGLAEKDEPVGAQGVSLTAERSIAVDKAIHVFGTPFFIAAQLPLEGDASNTKFRRLMIAQDTGSAIVGPARADIYFGSGDQAGRLAGRIKNPGRFVILIPRELDPIEAGRQMPQPVARPASAPGASPAKPPPEASVSTKPASAPLPRTKPKS